MFTSMNTRRITILLFMILSFTLLVYLYQPNEINESYSHADITLQLLYFIPVLFSAVWFGFKGGVIACVAITMLLSPHIVMNWGSYPWSGFLDFHRLLQVLIYFIVGGTLGLVTEWYRSAQARAREAEALAEIGRSIAVVAHDMQTPLVCIGGFSRLVKRHLDMHSPHRDKLDIVIKETGRLQGMIGDLLRYARPLKVNRTEQDVRKLIRECFALTEQVAKERRVKLRSEIPEDLRPWPLDPMKMKQALINLLTNAVHASPNEETVTVQVSQGNGNLSLEVVDAGCGIPPNQREEILSPFYTSKKEGTGLGLPIVDKIVRLHGGCLDILDNPTRGTTFRIVIPGL